MQTSASTFSLRPEVFREVWADPTPTPMLRHHAQKEGAQKSALKARMSQAGHKVLATLATYLYAEAVITSGFLTLAVDMARASAIVGLAGLLRQVFRGSVGSPVDIFRLSGIHR
jgi:hypothetical protein